MIKQEKLSDYEEYIEKEFWYVAREIVNLAWLNEKLVLIEPLVDFRVGKFVQLNIAKKYFKIADYEFRYKAKSKVFNNEIVIKSLTMPPLDQDNYKVLYTTKTRENEFSESEPWFIQDYIEALYDVTVVFIRDKMFVFELERSNFLSKTVDYR